MKLITLLASMFLLCGCSISRLKHGEASAINVRIFWTTEGFRFTAQTNGAVTIELQRSNPDAESLKAVAEGAAKGAAKGIMP